MISVFNAHKSYGKVRAVRGVGFELERGQVAGLLGPNGAGKSTTIRMITGFLPPDAGSITVGGHDVVTDPIAARAQMGYLPESAPLYPEMTPTGYLTFRAKLHGMPRRERAAAVGKAMDRCSLGEMAKRRIGQLSKGYKQRVGLAAALVHNPPVLILDEPTNGLDPTQIRETRRFIRELAVDHTMLVSSHILPEVELLCDRVIIVAGGRVRADGKPDELAAGEGSAYLVEINSDDRGWVRGLKGVASATGHPSDGPWWKWRLVAASDSGDLREPIAAAARGADHTIRELRRDKPTLENFFINVVNRAEEGDA